MSTNKEPLGSEVQETKPDELESAIPKELFKPIKKKDKKRKKKKNKDVGYSKNTIGILRTTLRNNIELTNIADNKANVLLSLNALMLTFIVPLMIPNQDLILEQHLFIPLGLLILTCLATISIAVFVLRPGKLGGQKIQINEKSQISPFFFGNFERMSKGDYLEYSNAVLEDEVKVRAFIGNDFYHIGARLSEKMRWIRMAFNIFIFGLVVSIILTFALIYIL